MLIGFKKIMLLFCPDGIVYNTLSYSELRIIVPMVLLTCAIYIVLSIEPCPMDWTLVLLTLACTA